MAIAEALAQALFELPASGIAWALQRTTSLKQQTAELIANFVVVGVIAGACFAVWFVYQST
jgi:hypothetical protein